jgi:hypothetical protein
LLEFLEKEDVQRYRYITLGFGEAQMQKLSMLTKARTLDGGYYTARQLPILKESGIWTIDAVKHADPELRTLAAILENASSYNLRWILVKDTFYYDILHEHGFRLNWSLENSGDIRFGNVTIWEKQNVPPIEMDSKSERGFWSYMWGVAPLLLIGALILTLLRKIKKGLLEKLI